MAKILLCEDEADLARAVAWKLTNAGHVVLIAATGAEALRLYDDERPDLVLLDIQLPDIQGTEVLRRLQQRAPERELPIVFVTARDQELDRILGYEHGAADSVVKPFSLQELVLRVGALLRRTQAATGENIIDLPPLRVDLACERVTVEGRPVELSHIEFQILRTLASPPGRVRTREEILRAVWGDASSVFDRTVDAHLARLRRRLGSASERVRTLRGAGYKLA
jgi:two-component system phosphate regulon response regulator PhoB